MKVKLWLLGIATVFLPIKELMITIGFLVAMDMVVGIWKDFYPCKLRSRKLTHSLNC
jgi:hypothetical protein